MLLGPNMIRSHGLLPLLNSSSVFGTKASSGMTSTSSLIPSLSYRSFSTSDSEYFTYSAFTTARMVVPSYGFLPWAGTPAAKREMMASETRSARIPNRFMEASLALAFRAAEREPLDEVALQREGDRECREHTEHDGGGGLAVEHVGAARRERRDQD